MASHFQIVVRHGIGTILLLLGLMPTIAANDLDSPPNPPYIYPASVMPHDVFGNEIAISGSWAVVGAYQADTTIGTDAGEAYVLQWDDMEGHWKEFQRLSEEAIARGVDVAAGDEFGIDVAIHGDWIAVGSDEHSHSGTTSNSGSVNLFKWSDTSGMWEWRQELFDTTASQDAHFGEALALEGTTLVVGALNDADGAQLGAGAVSVFEYDPLDSTWSLSEKLRGETSTSVDNDFFGEDVAIAGARIVVGASRADTDTLNACGAAYVFEQNGASWPDWEHRLVPADAGDGDFGGESVDVEGDRLIIGAWHHSLPVSEAGAAYVYEWDGIARTWQESSKLQPFNEQAMGGTGLKAQLLGDRAVVSNFSMSINGNMNQGSISVFRLVNGSWKEDAQFSDPDGAPLDVFGSALAAEGSRILVGAQSSDLLAVDAGVVYALDVSDLTHWHDLGGGTVGLKGQPTVDGTGPLIEDSPVCVVLTNAPPSAPTLLWLSLSSTPLWILGGTVYPFPPLSESLHFTLAVERADGHGDLPSIPHRGLQRSLRSLTQ